MTIFMSANINYPDPEWQHPNSKFHKYVFYTKIDKKPYGTRVESENIIK